MFENAQTTDANAAAAKGQVALTEDAAALIAAGCFAEYGVRTDASGKYAALYRPSHLIGLEFGISVASAVLRNEPTGLRLRGRRLRATISHAVRDSSKRSGPVFIRSRS